MVQHLVNRIFLVSCALLFSLYLTSCASYQKYPSEWSALIPVENDKCPDILGIYTIEDESICPPNFDVDKFKIEPPEIATNRESLGEDRQCSPLYLYEVFPMKYFIFRGRITGATNAQISKPDDDTFEISFFNDQGLIDKKNYSLKKKEYTCSPKGIQFHFSSGGGLSGVASGGMGVGPIPFALAAGGWGKYFLSKSVDGSLIVKEEGTADAVFIIIPVWQSYEVWHRFKPKFCNRD